MNLSGATGTGTASGESRSVTGDVGETAAFTATVDIAAADPRASMSFKRPHGRDDGRLLLADPIEVVISEPVTLVKLGAARVLANGKPLSGEFAMTSPVHGLVTHAAFLSREFAPSGATLTLDPAGLTNTNGHPIAWDGASMTTAADPGPLTANASFEHGLRGWQATGDARVTGAFGGVPPAAGTAQAVIDAGASLSGYLDVPSGATELAVSYAVFSEAGEFNANQSVVVALVAEDGSRTTVVDGAVERAHDERGEFEPGLRHRIGPRTARIDLTRHRGRRVTLTADVRSGNYLGLQ
ncbi:MAG TPA: hypothetical protein VMF13_07500, partial [Luteitalea sp.]|nr:hypothetical protein [Luteitalea sp.]